MDSYPDSSAASEFLADPGPEFDPRDAPEEPTLEEDELDLRDEMWHEETIRTYLITQGNVTHAIFKAGPNDTETWKHTEDDLNAIAPPLTRILNRYDATRAAAIMGDEIGLAAAVAAYGARNYTRRRRLLAELQDQPPEPVTGTAAEPDTGPEHDPQWQRIREAPPAIVPKGRR